VPNEANPNAIRIDSKASRPQYFILQPNRKTETPQVIREDSVLRYALFPLLSALSHQACREILEERKAEWRGKISPYVFTDPAGNRLFDYGNGRPKAKREVYSAWHSECKEAQLAGRRLPHGLRGTGAINRRNAGIADDLNMAGGWRTRAMLDRYLGKKRGFARCYGKT
jgi:hypothetical protein